MDRISTRCDQLDIHLNGGIPEGAIATLVASPASQCSPLFYGFLEGRSWLYITTYRSEEAVKRELDELLWGSVEVVHAGVERPIKNAHRALTEADGERNVIVDTTNPLEATEDTTQYTRLLNGLKEYLLDTGCIALLYATEYDQQIPTLRETTLTVSDIVMELETVKDGRELNNFLQVPKCRRMETIDEVIKLDLGEGVTVDTSRSIA